VINHGGKDLIYLDSSGCKLAELTPLVARAKRMIAGLDHGSALVLTNVENTQLTKETSALMKDLTTHNKPYVKASAVVGVEGLKQIVFNAVQAVSGRTLASFDTLEHAKDWLVKQ
jgi:hypothetical protein